MADPIHQSDMGLIHQSFVNGATHKVGESIEALAKSRQKNTWSWGKKLLVGLATVATGGVIGGILIGVHARRAARLERKYNELTQAALNFHKALAGLRAAERQLKPYETSFRMGKEKVTLTYSHEAGAQMRFHGIDGQKKSVFENDVVPFDASRTMQKFEMDVMRHPEAYGKRVVDEVLSTYDQVINNVEGRNQAANQRDLQALEAKAKELKHGAEAAAFESSEGAQDDVNVAQADRLLGQNSELTGMSVTLLREAKDRLRALACELLTTRFEMAPAECDFLEAGMSLHIMREVLAGNMKSAEDVRGYVNRNATGRLFTTVESRTIYDQFEKAQARENGAPQVQVPIEDEYHPIEINVDDDESAAGVQNNVEVKTSDVKFAADYRSVKKNDALPPAELQPVHDFVAEVISSDYAALHDRSFGADGHVNGTRLRDIVGRNTGVMGELMENRAQQLRGEPAPDLLAQVDPKLKEAIVQLLDDLNDRFFEESENYNGLSKAREKLPIIDTLEPNHQQRYRIILANHKAKYGMGAASRTEFLNRELAAVDKRNADMRDNLGTDTIEDISDHDFADVLKTEYGQSNEDLKELSKDDPTLSRPESREKVALSLDFFGQKEKAINEGIAASMASVQQDIDAMIDDAFGNVEENRSFTAAEMADKTLAQIIGNPGANGDMKLVREVLKHYFAEMPDMDKRSMLAAMTRYSKADASKGARFGALLKGAGPVMQKMLQGMNESLFQNEDFRAALSDMRSNLAPIAERAVQAYLFDLVKASKTTEHPVSEITVEQALGAASISQALKCAFKMADGTVKHCVVKMVRPEAEMRAKRELAVFQQAAETVGGGMDRTFLSRYEGILAELDLRVEAENVKTGVKVYDYHRASYDNKHLGELQETYGTFANVHSMKLAENVAPTKSLLVLEEVPGMTLEKFNQATGEESSRVKAEAVREAETSGSREKAGEIVADAAMKLGRLYDEARKKYEAVQNLTYMWVNEGLFAEGFYHGDVHKGNVMVQAGWKEENADGANPGYDGITLIDFGNATRLNPKEKKSVLQVVAGCAAGEPSLFVKGFEAMLSTESLAKFKNPANHADIKAKVQAILAKGTLADTAVRLAAILEVLQRDYQMEVPGAIHNFLESQRRLEAAMEESANLMKQIAADRKALLEAHPELVENEEPADLEEMPDIAENDENEENVEEALALKKEAIDLKSKEIGSYRFRPMVQCIADVVMQNLMATMKSVGIAKGSRCFARITSEMEAINQAQQPAIDAQGHVGAPQLITV